jgi:hypothetical protein
MSRKKEEIANDILNYCKKNKIRFYTTRYERRRIKNSEDGSEYTVYQLARGVRWLTKNNIFKHVSKRRFEVTSYDMEKEKSV